jgi:hypothetical protein
MCAVHLLQFWDQRAFLRTSLILPLAWRVGLNTVMEKAPMITAGLNNILSFQSQCSGRRPSGDTSSTEISASSGEARVDTELENRQYEDPNVEVSLRWNRRTSGERLEQ